MRTLTDHEKRTVRIAAIAVGIYLVLFGGWHVWQFLQTKRAQYDALLKQADALKQQIAPYKERVLVIQKLMEGFHMDPAKLSRATLVGDASAAIQKAAMSSGIQVGPVREPPARSTSRELSLQMEATGTVPALMGLLNRLESVGYPLIIDEVQINPETTRPGQLKVNLTIIILDFEQWKSQESSHA